ncbi:hypothetical protein [Winogradskyella sp.]|uniref:hypothetical protein n=1 Tax=Winogradskyella sp. TaxID=1883156 RepID=UPI003BA94ECD
MNQLKTLATLVLILFAFFAFPQSPRFTIKSDGMEAINYLQMDDFYLTHHLYIDLFLRENLFPDATADEVSTILSAIKTYVAEDSPLEIEVKKPGKANYIIKMAILKKDDMELLIAFTNWSPQKKTFEKEIKMENDSYTRWYFLNDDKMTYRKDMSDQSDYNSLEKVDLVNAYLFDELLDNDELIEPTIEALLKDDGLAVEDRIMAQLIWLKYAILKRDSEKIASLVDDLRQQFETDVTHNLRGLEVAFKATEFQIELMK